MKRRELFCVPAMLLAAPAAAETPADLVPCPSCLGTGEEMLTTAARKCNCWACDGTGLLPRWQAKATHEYLAELDDGLVGALETDDDRLIAAVSAALERGDTVHYVTTEEGFARVLHWWIFECREPYRFQHQDVTKPGGPPSFKMGPRNAW